MNPREQEGLADLYSNRFDPEHRQEKNVVWQTLCDEFFQKYVRDSDVVLDLGAGYCEFINNIRCKIKIAVDLNEETHDFAGPGVQVVMASVTDMTPIESESVDVVFCSNVYEHLHSKDELMLSLKDVLRVLKPGGRFLIMMPNIRYAFSQYWDFFDHHLPLSHLSLAEGLTLAGFNVEEVRGRFLPYSTKSRFPKAAALIKLYLKLPPLHAVLGKQMFLASRKPAVSRS